MVKHSLLILSAILCLGSIGQSQELQEVSITSSLDQSSQPSIVYVPTTMSETVPLIVLLHTWSGNYKQTGHIELVAKECERRGWAMIHPNFRGPNWTPQACGSPFAVQDVVDAVEWMQKHHSINAKRIYLTGVSGGGHMSMLMAGKHPEIWAGVSAWVGISDVSAWHTETKAAQRGYFAHIEKAVGGAPGTSAEIDEQLKARSPLTWIERAKGLPIDLNAGIHDGHSGSVPISHTLLAFNKLAEANGHAAQELTPEQIETMTKTESVPAPLKFSGEQEPRKHEILFRRSAGPVRVTIFEGGHEGDLMTAMEWLSHHSR